MAIFKKLFLGDTVATSGNKCFRKLTTRNITFTIGGTQFEAEPNMTWGEWLESAYNTSGYYTKTITSGGVEYNPIIIAENDDAFTVVEIKGGVMEIGNGISANSEYLLVTLTQDSESIVGTWVFNDTVDTSSMPTRVKVEYTSVVYNGNTLYGTEFTNMMFDNLNGGNVYYNGVYAYKGGAWLKSGSKTVTFKAEPTTNAEVFKNWLKANATKQ